MAGAGYFVRRLAAVISGAIALFFLLIAAFLPFQLRKEAQEDRAYYQQFREAGAYAANYAAQHAGRLPYDDALRKLGDPSDVRGIWGSLTSDGSCSEGGFQQAPSDRFTLSFWRGEWTECFSYPSGKTTLPMSVAGYLRSGLGRQWAIWWLIGIVAAYTAIRVGWRKRALRTA